MKNKKEHVNLMLLIIILIASNLYTRNTEILKKIEIAINFIMILYVVIKLAQNKIKIIKSKLDIFVILLVVSTIIPIVFNTYISLSSSIYVALDYSTMLWIYLLTREICQKDTQNIKFIKNFFIFFTVILIFVGIENISSNKIFELLNISIGNNGENRLVSVFGNPNVFSSLIMLSFFICINEMININVPIKKAIYGTCNTIFILGIILTYSKLTFLIFPILLLIYIIRVKQKSQKIHIIQNILISLIYALIYVLIFQDFLKHEYYIGIWIFTFVWIAIVILSNSGIIKSIKYFENMRLKKIIVISITFIVIFAIWFGFELRNGKEYVVFYENTQSDYNAKIIRNIKPNEKYILSFDMYAEFFSEENVENFFEIKLIERGEKGLDEITSQEYTFGNFSGIKELELYTTSDTSEIKIEFRTKSEETQKYWVVNNLKLNGKEVILEYKHLPTKLIEKIKDTNIQYKTAKIRFDFICDGLNLISQNFLTGIGGGGWFQKYGEVQERDYIAIDPHNYYIQIWLEFGILGLISVIGITYIVISFKYKDEEQNATYKGIKFAILAVLLRSTLDWDMYILAIRLIIFLCLGILANVLEKYEIKRNTIISNMILLIITISTITLNLVPEIYDKSINIEKLEKEIVKLDEKSDKFKEYNQKIIDLSNNIIKHERTDSTIIIYESKKIEAYIKSGEEELDAMLQNYYEKMVTVKNKWLHNEEKITEKSNYITAILSMLEDKNNPRYNDWMKKIAQINIDEFQETKNQLTKIYNEKYKNIKEEEEYIIFVNNYNYAIRICETNK